MPPIPKKALFHLLSLAGIYFCSAAFLMQFPRYVLKMGGSAQTAGVLLGMGLVPALILSSAVGDWVRRSGIRKPAQLGAYIAAISCLLMLMVSAVGPWMFVIHLLYATGHAIVFASLVASAAMLADDRIRRAQIIGWLAVTIQIGSAVGGLIGEMAFRGGSTAYWFAFATIAFLAGLLALFAPSEVQQAELPHSVEVKAPAAFQKVTWPVEVWALAAAGMAFAALTNFMPAHIENLAKVGQVAQPFAAAWFVTTGLLAVALVRLAAGYYAERLLKPGVLMICHGLLLLTLLLSPLMQSRGNAIALALVFGLSYGWLYPALNSLAFANIPASARGKVAGWLVIAFDIGFRVGAVGLGALIEYAGYQAMYWGVATAYMVLIALSHLATRREKSRLGFAR